MISDNLARQLDSLREQLSPATAGALLCSWWSSLPLPDGINDIRPLSFLEWQGVMNVLRQSALIDGVVPSFSSLIGLTVGLRHDGPLPVALARYRVASPKQAVRDAICRAAAEGTTLPEPLSPVAEMLESHEVFVTGIPMHQQWNRAIPLIRSRLLVWSFDQRFWCSAPGAPLPDEIQFDAGDGQGARHVTFGQSLMTTHPTGDSVTYSVTARWGDDVRVAQGTVSIGGPAVPIPDETWVLNPPGSPGGHAFVYHPNSRQGSDLLSMPVVLSEGFPGGWACDYLYEMANQHRLLERLLDAGHSVILLGYNAGYIHIPSNASVAIACLQQISSRTSDPVSIGGVSMGGQVTRYALAWLEWTGQPHPCHLYFSIDTPHLGSVTSVAVQWFVREFAHVLAGAAEMEALIGTPANREFLMAFLETDGTREDPAHIALLADFQAVGNFPKQPRCIAVSSGHGRGGRFLDAGTTLLTWTGHPFAEATLRVSGPDPSVLVAEGACYPKPDDSVAATYVNHECWEGVPGGQSNYIGAAAAIAEDSACGVVSVHSASVCVVPTVSALYLRQRPDLPIPEEPGADSPFQAWATADENLNHCGLSAHTAEFLFRELTAVASSVPGYCSPSDLPG